jgi:hypothetical protein
MLGPADVMRLRDLHERHKHEQLELDEAAAYESLRDAFAAAFVRAHRVSIRPGQTYRQAVRAACAIQLELTVEGRAHRTITLELSAQGFAALVGVFFELDAPCAFNLRIRPNDIRGTGRVRACERYGSGNLSYRVLVAFDPLSTSDVQRIEGAVFDAALASLG